MFLGKECHHPSCHLNDFLPFSVSTYRSSRVCADFQCPACHLSYCQPHFLPSHHSCSSPLPKSMQDRIAPQCPLCNSVVPSTPNGDPNEAVDRHLNTGTCAGIEGGEARRKELLRQKKDKGEVCWRKGCAKTLVVKIKCEVSTFCFAFRVTSANGIVMLAFVLPNTSKHHCPYLFQRLDAVVVTRFHTPAARPI